MDNFVAESGVVTHGLGARGLNQYDGTVRNISFKSIETFGNDSISNSPPRLSVRAPDHQRLAAPRAYTVATRRWTASGAERHLSWPKYFLPFSSDTAIQ